MQQQPIGLRSRAHIVPFDLERPSAVDAVLDSLAAPGRAALMAGGLDLIDRLKRAEPLDRMISLRGIAAMSSIDVDADGLSIGALATHADIVRSPVLAQHLPDLAAIWQNVANPRVRAVGTLGGNIMSGLPHYDGGPAFRALAAEAVVVDPLGLPRTIPLDDLAGRTDLLLLALRVPLGSGRKRLLADRSLHPVVSVYLGATLADGVLQDATVAVGCAYTRPKTYHLPLAGKAAALVREAAAALPDPLDDDQAGSGYRRRMIEVLLRRLLQRFGDLA